MKLPNYPSPTHRFEIARAVVFLRRSFPPRGLHRLPPSLLPFARLLRRPHLRRLSPPVACAAPIESLIPSGRPSSPRSKAPSPAAAFPRRLPAPPQLRILPRWPHIPRRPPPSTPTESSRSAAAAARCSFLLLNHCKLEYLFFLRASSSDSDSLLKLVLFDP